MLYAHLTLDPAAFTDYHFNYLTQAAHQANLSAGKDGFSGAQTQPPIDARIDSGSTSATVSRAIGGMQPATTYVYRIVARNSFGTTVSASKTFRTQPPGGTFVLPDGRGWEMVTPVEKTGGQFEGAGSTAGGGVFQAAAEGSAITYSMKSSFGEDAEGAPVASQYIAQRTAGGWVTDNVTTPVVSGSYGTEADGAPYQLFSENLLLALLLNGRPCRGTGTDCGVANPPLAGTDAPAGYQNFYLRHNSVPSFEALLGGNDISQSSLSAEEFDVAFAGAAPDLNQVVVSSCAALTPAATEAPLGEGCDPDAPNLYRWSGGTLDLVNVTPGAALAAQSRAISSDGSRVYWTAGGDLYLREFDVAVKQVDGSAGGGGEFQTASLDGSVAYFTKEGHLYRYAAGTNTATDLTPAGDVEGVLGASDDGSSVYFLTGSGLFLRRGATTTEVAEDADAGSYPPTTGTAHLTPDGSHLAFVSDDDLTGYDNIDLESGEPDTQVYLYDSLADQLTCASCNPTNGRPIGPSALPGATANGEGPDAPHLYKPRALSSDGSRVYFDSADAIAPHDTNLAPDVYQWEDGGAGSCQVPTGCVDLISGGKSEEGAFFVDASSSGGDVYFGTDGSLVPGDPGLYDLYDARVGGGFPVPPSPIPCEGDACQSLPPVPEVPVVNTIVSGAGNPPIKFFDTNRHRPRYHRLRNHRHKRSGKRCRRNGGEVRKCRRNRGRSA